MKVQWTSFLNSCFATVAFTLFLSTPFSPVSAQKGKSAKATNPIVGVYLQDLTKRKTLTLANVPASIKDKATVLKMMTAVRRSRQQKLILRKNGRVRVAILRKGKKGEDHRGTGRWVKKGKNFVFTFKWKTKANQKGQLVWTCTPNGSRLTCSWPTSNGKQRQRHFLKK